MTKSNPTPLEKIDNSTNFLLGEAYVAQVRRTRLTSGKPPLKVGSSDYHFWQYHDDRLNKIKLILSQLEALKRAIERYDRLGKSASKALNPTILGDTGPSLGESLNLEPNLGFANAPIKRIRHGL